MPTPRCHKKTSSPALQQIRRVDSLLLLSEQSQFEFDLNNNDTSAAPAVSTSNVLYFSEHHFGTRQEKKDDDGKFFSRARRFMRRFSLFGRSDSAAISEGRARSHSPGNCADSLVSSVTEPSFSSLPFQTKSGGSDDHSSSC